MSDLAYATLLRVLDNSQPGADWSADTWRDEAALAELTGSEIRAAHRHAVDAGYLKVLGDRRPGGFCHLSRASQHPASKGRPVQVYERTEKRVKPVTVMAGQGALFQ